MKILVTRQIPDAGLKLLKAAGHTLDIYTSDNAIPRAELLKRVKNVDALLSLLTDKIDEEVMQAAGPKLKVIGNYAVGFDNIDLPAAKRHGIAVTNTPAPEVAESVAEHTIMLMLGLAHRLVESDAFARAKKYKGWSPTLLMGNDLGGKTLGIVGTGRIGSSVARRAVLGLGMKCLYEDHRRQPELEKTLGAEPASLEQLLQRADVVSLHVPLTPDTRHMISVAEFALMKKTAFLINTARGPVVDEKALLRALRTKRIAGAALDVFECEPSIDCDLTDKLELKSFDNVIITPHTASATIEARQAMSKLAAENIIAVLSGKPPLNPAK
jgi:glyoxylate reductase